MSFELRLLEHKIEIYWARREDLAHGAGVKIVWRVTETEKQSIEEKNKNKIAIGKSCIRKSIE